MKIDIVMPGFIGNVSVFHWGREPTRTDILQFYDTDILNNHELCMKAVNDAVRRLPAGFYTYVHHDCCYIGDFCVSKRGRVQFRPWDGTTKNITTHQRPCLRVIVSA